MFKRACLVAVASLASVLPATAFAATAVEEAQSLVAQGDLNGALKRLDRYLASSPQDAEARFTRGLVLVKLNKTPEAIKAFADLTRDYPQLPEPYNNLAVLYAQQGDYEKARAALEAALATHPSYATAHENLGDIYAALAGAAYNRALSLDAANQSVRYKLSLISQLNGTPTTASAPPPPAAAVAQAPVSAMPPPESPLPAPAAAAPAAPPVAAASTDTTAAAAPAVAVDEAGINTLLNGWSQAWSSQNTDAYLAYYSPNFKPELGLTRETWATMRRERISKPTQISVGIHNPQITALDATHAQVSFSQDYRADKLADKVTKVLDLENTDGSWKIVRESVH
ncbi:MAG: tetratricopeptide repeat protein [Nevskia sp.]|nr:tetratricopeptide repeat protein [Nevskia sp.]